MKLDNNTPNNESNDNSENLEELQEELFYELFRDLPRQGPGSIFSTRKAYELISGLPEKPDILDVGCGHGMQSLELARLSQGKVIATDNYQPFLDRLKVESMAAELDHYLTTQNASMFELPFEDNTFDLIWSEGAIYIMGFEEGLKNWKKLLKPGGFVAITDATWFTKDRPEEIQSFWDAHYPAITTVDENLEKIENSGYEIVGNFSLPADDWWTHYYTHLEAKLPAYLEKHAGNETANAIAGMTLEEMDMHDKYSDFYGYEFYIGKKK